MLSFWSKRKYISRPHSPSVQERSEASGFVTYVLVASASSTAGAVAGQGLRPVTERRRAGRHGFPPSLGKLRQSFS